MKKNTIHFLLMLSTLLVLNSCTNDSDVVLETETVLTCDTNDSSFKQLYEEMLQTDVTVAQESTYDFEVHGYTFEVASNKRICSIGYQSFASDPNVSYKIEIIDNTTNSQIYYGEHVFSQTDISYIQLATPVDIVANSTYTIKRTQELNIAAEGVIGNIIYKYDNLQYQDILPYTLGDLTVLTSGTDVYISDTTPYEDNQLNYLPVIDIVFSE